MTSDSSFACFFQGDGAEEGRNEEEGEKGGERGKRMKENINREKKKGEKKERIYICMYTDLRKED